METDRTGDRQKQKQLFEKHLSSRLAKLISVTALSQRCGPPAFCLSSPPILLLSPVLPISSPLPF